MSTRSGFVGSSGRWVRRGGTVVLLPGAARPGPDGGEQDEVAVTATAAGVIDSRIDVHAQYALLRMAKGDPSARADAAAMLAAVKSGLLAGIYKEDQQVPALRARRQGKGWWQLVPAGRDAAVVREAGAAPILVFRDGVRLNAARLDPALRAAWKEAAAGTGVPAGRCTIPANGGGTLRTVRMDVAKRQAAPPTPLPKLCLWQNTNNASHAAYFRRIAGEWAQQTGAVEVTPGASACMGVGASRYDSGADIDNALRVGSVCRGARLTEVHVFGHSLQSRLIGRAPNSGVVTGGDLDRGAGGIMVADLATSVLDPDVTFVLHGCNTATGNTNFARARFDHLNANLSGGTRGPRVFGHNRSVCAGQREFWREFSRTAPAGGPTLRRIPIYWATFCPDQP